MICVPKKNIQLETILYAVGYLNKQRWRFSYGRKAYEQKKNKILIEFPSHRGKLDEDKIKHLFRNNGWNNYFPTINTTKTKIKPKKFALFPITKIITIKSGDYHNASVLDVGNIPLVSCGEVNNGVMKHVNVAQEDTHMNTITIAYNRKPLATMYHPYKFTTKDDVAIGLIKPQIKQTTLIYLKYIINRQQWRYSYGRKCFKEKIQNLQVYFPVDDKGDIDEIEIEKIVKNTSYWKSVIHNANRHKPNSN